MFLAPLIPVIAGMSTGAMAATGISAASALVTGIAGGMAAKSAANYNADMARRQGEQARVKGDMDAAKLARSQRQEAGAQRAKLGASGVQMGSGNAADIQTHTQYMHGVDQNTLEYNTRMAQWGYRAEEINQKARGKNAMIGGIISGVAGAAGAAATGYMSSTPATGGRMTAS